AESVFSGNTQFTNSGTGPDLQRPNSLRNHLDASVRYFLDWIGRPVRFDRSRHLSLVRLLLRKRSSAASLVGTFQKFSSGLLPAGSSGSPTLNVEKVHSSKKFSRIVRPCGCSSSKSSG